MKNLQEVCMIKVFIQVTAGSPEKKLYNEKTLEYKGTRQVSLPYPYAYGFILNTNAGDGDNLDCYVITKESLMPGTVVECEPIGLLEQHEGEELDHKILAVLPGQDVALSENLLKEFQDFIYAAFAQYPEVKVRVGPIHPQDTALQHIQACRKA
jgi:inorganic pyrophosphatase